MPKTWRQIRIWLVTLTIFQVFTALPVRAGETNAAIPYKELEEMFQPISVVDPAKLQIHVFVSSTNKAVRPADITLTIHSKVKGLVPVRLGTNGQVADFPLAKELHRENPPVMANQPAGTMRFVVALQIPPLDELTFPYRRLADGVAELNKSI
jgi:hypothetical protein